MINGSTMPLFLAKHVRRTASLVSKDSLTGLLSALPVLIRPLSTTPYVSTNAITSRNSSTFHPTHVLHAMPHNLILLRLTNNVWFAHFTVLHAIGTKPNHSADHVRTIPFTNKLKDFVALTVTQQHISISPKCNA